MPCRLISPLLVACLTLFGILFFDGRAEAETRPAPEARRAETLQASLQAAVDHYVRSGALEEFAPEGGFVLAPASGGVFGWLDIRLGFWYPALDGVVQSSGERIDTEGDLGIDDNEGTVVPDITVTFGPFGIRFDGFFLEFEGQSTINRSFDFGGFTFIFNENVSSRIEINNFRLFSTYALVKTSSFRLLIEVGISVFDLDAEVTGETTGTARESGTIPIPLVGLRGQAKLGRFLLEVEVSGFTIEFDDVEGTLLDIQASVGATVFKVVAVRVGYRIITLDGTADNFLLDVTLDGFFASATVTF